MATLAPSPRLRGREVELRELGDAFGRLASGHPSIVLIEGETGLGKTRLLADAVTAARSRGLQVATGQAQELERARPFGVLGDAFGCAASSPDPRRRAIATLLATSAGDRGPVTVTSDPGLQFQAVDAFVDLAESLALARPLVMGVDDLQWADPWAPWASGPAIKSWPGPSRAACGRPGWSASCCRRRPSWPSSNRGMGPRRGAQSVRSEAQRVTYHQNHSIGCALQRSLWGRALPQTS